MAIHEASVVLIEDEPEIRRFLRTTLPEHNFRLYEATTGQEGLIEAKVRNPDVVLLDLGLPDLDGVEIIKQLREWTHIPIIVLSARFARPIPLTSYRLRDWTMANQMSRSPRK